MASGISAYTNLPTPVKVGLLAVGGGSIVTAIVYFVPARLLWVLFIGLAFVALLLLLYWRVLKWFKKRKAAPMERGVIENTSAAPRGVSEAAHLARLDDLRKKFEDGIAKFQAAGKSLYNFPWYMIVGEPGSGKTEAIRHCNVGFPPGLQDQFQGAGGTLNMNWWFTDHAVIVDTAGRLMFEEVETGGSSEWKEFLNLLRKSRPRCPINGVFLVIPADSLIRDTADEIDRKASKIARQFDVIQRSLDVRFPVFVVITKSDLINGFRDFFDNLQDPQLQHQILGWSNPAPLDEPYNPDFVDQHLKTIQERLFRRRLALLREIVSESDGRGMENVRTPDTLYAFPQSLAKIAPRMARYLELIFSVGSQWSCKPLFFRGIYFTSSMREGSALDEDLAESLGVPIDSLPDGRVWERDRAYFLRDLFIKKVFRERGLVTYATNAKKLHTRRKAAVLISAAASVVLLLLFTVYAGVRFRQSIGEMREYFEVPARLIASSGSEPVGGLRVIKREAEDNYRYIGRAGIPGMPEDVSRSDFCSLLGNKVNYWEEKGVPWIFAPAAKFARGITPEKINKAQAAVYEAAVLQPFVASACDMMDTQQNGKWTRENPETRALLQLIRLKAAKSLNEEGEYSARTFLDPLFEYVFRREEGRETEEDFTKRVKIYNEDRVKLHQPISMIYGAAWPPAFPKSDPIFLERAIENGAALSNAYWSDSNQVGADSRDYANVETIQELEEAFDEFDAAEKRLLMLRNRFGAESKVTFEVERWEKLAKDWNEGFKRLSEARGIINNCVASLKNPSSLSKLWTDVANSALQDINEHYGLLLAEMETEQAQKDDFLGRIRERLKAAHGEITNKLSKNEFEQSLKVIDERFNAQLRDGDRLYESRFQMYSACNEQLDETRPSALEQVPGAVEKLKKSLDQARRRISNLLSLDRGAYRFKEASEVSGFVIDLAEQSHLYSIVDASLQPAPKNVKEIGDLIEKQATWDWKDIAPEIVNRRYDPEAAAALLGGWRALADILKRLPGEADLRKRFNDANAVYVEYPALYFEYWLDKVPDHMVAGMVERDSEQFKSLIIRNVFDKLIGNLGSVLDRAVTSLEQYAPQDAGKVRQFRANLDKVRDRRKYDKLYYECRTVINKWRELSDNLWDSREVLLSVTPANYLEDYAPFRYESPAEFVDMYWTELTLRLLSRRSEQVQNQGRGAFDNLKTRFGGKFPLERDSEADLTPAELVEARSLLNKVSLQKVFSSATIGAGAETGFDKLDEQLKRLREVPPPGPYKEWFKGIEQVFKCLPEGEDPYYCRMTLLGQDEQRKLVREGEELLLDYLTEFRLIQGDYRSGRSNTRSRENLSVGMVKYAGPPLLIEFYKYPSDTEAHTTVEVAQPWAPLRVFRRGHDGRKKGYVRLEIKGKEGVGGVLYLQLDFCRDNDCKYVVDFPKPDQWPSLKGTR
ncbi:MAG: type VI secretion protein IcmF/TssM N-terminal domain-containing protein [Planctomycetota bacterium]|jgi:hypothetical protein